MADVLLTAKFRHLPPPPQRISGGNFQSKVTVVSAEPRRAGEGVDGMGGGGSGAGRQPSLSASIRKPRGDMGAGQDTGGGEEEEEGRGVRTGSRSLACHPPALQSIPRHLPPSPPPSASAGCSCVTPGPGAGGRPRGRGNAGSSLFPPSSHHRPVFRQSNKNA